MFNQLASSLRLEHRHSDGTWSPLARSHHDPADHDPERDWIKGEGEIYSCTTCDEQVRVSASEAQADRPVGASG